MLTAASLIGFVPTRDAARAREFYEGTLQLRFVQDDGFAIVMDANGTMIRIVRVGSFTPFPFTLLGWDVADINREVDDLTARGVAFARYPHFDQGPTGIWTAPGGAAWVAWFSDRDANILSVSQHRGLS